MEQKLNSIVASLTPADVASVEQYASTLAKIRASSTSLGRPDRPNRIDLDGLDGLLTRMTDEMAWPEIKIRLRNAWADAAED